MSAHSPIPGRNLAYALLRVALGLDMLLHGATRIGAGVNSFASKLVPEFEKTVLPASLVHAFGVTLPFVEALLGLLLILGWLTRWALLGEGLLLLVLIFGTGLRSEWNTVGLQLGYVFVVAWLLSRLEDNAYAVDSVAARGPP